MNDRTKPLAPLSLESTESLGEPESILVSVSGGLDQRALAWPLGSGSVRTGVSPTSRETIVRIWLLPAGVLLTNVRTTSENGNSVTSTGKYHETPQGALDWLIENGRGKLGPASKAAWGEACHTFSPMNGMDIEEEEPQQNRLLQEVGDLSSDWFALNVAHWPVVSLMRFPSRPFIRSNGHVGLRFEWQRQPPHSPARGEFNISVEAAKLLSTMPRRSRLGALRQAIERKYVSGTSNFQPGGEPWPIRADDLKGVEIR